MACMDTSSRQTIALLTDFGLQDAYVGVMKGVMRHICAQAEFIDITHEIQPQNVRQAALTLLSAFRYFPPGTIFLVVVDPGVGSARRPVAVQAAEYRFVAPDNGVLSYALGGQEIEMMAELANPAFQLQPASQTFHGRDIFAPAAAHLAEGVPIDQLGPTLTTLNLFPTPELDVGHQKITGEVIHIDHFGNVVTSIGELVWADAAMLVLTPRFGNAGVRHEIRADDVSIALNARTIHGLQPTYSEVSRGDLLALVGSSGFLELAVNQGSGAERLDASIGDPVEMRF